MFGNLFRRISQVFIKVNTPSVQIDKSLKQLKDKSKTKIQNLYPNDTLNNQVDPLGHILLVLHQNKSIHHQRFNRKYLCFRGRFINQSNNQGTKHFINF